MALFLSVCLLLSAATRDAVGSTTPRDPLVAGEAGSSCRGVYYDALGCFSMLFPFNNTHALPQNPSFVSTTFSLYTRRNRRHAHDLTSTGGRSRGTELVAGRPIKVLVHGFLQNGATPWMTDMTHAFLRHDDVNVITVDWSRGAGFPYTQAVANTRLVGAELARLVRRLATQRGVSYRHFHLIGHSLGAHVAGHTGRILGGRIARITGLDPADPHFSYQPPAVRLDPTDAHLVDVIHTDGSVYTTYSGYGTLEPMGHMDFYPNGGIQQPGCHLDTSLYRFARDAYQEGMTNAEYDMTCSHDRSTQLFIESITSPCPFTAYRCANEDDFRAGLCRRCGNRPCPSMGFWAGLYKNNGTFFLKTAASAPFCGYHYVVEVRLADHMASVAGQIHVHINGDRGRATPSLLLHSGDMRPGQGIRAVLLAPHNVGHVSNATLTFTPAPTFFSWFSASSVKVKAVMVEAVKRRQTLYFCPPSSEPFEGDTIVVAGGNHSPGFCFQP